MLENRETVPAKDGFLTVANIWQLRRLDPICPLLSIRPRRDVRVSNVSITGVVLLPSPEIPCALRFPTPWLGREN